MPAGGNWYDPMVYPLANATVEDLDGFTWMPPFSFYRLPDVNQLDAMVDGVGETAKYWYENSDKALIGFAGASIFETAQGLRGFENLYIDFMDNRRFLERLFDKIAEANVEYAKRYCEAVADYVHVIVIGGEDIGAQGRLQINPDLYREIVIPRIRRLWQTFKTNTRAYLFVHSCGFIEPVIGDMIDAGIDIINPVQIGAGMDPRRLKERFGDRVTFWGGGCDTQRTLPRETPEIIRSEVRERIKVLAPGGGYVFAAEQTIQSDVPPENVVAMYDAAREYGKYPIEGT
jgi:uroporphyrinogen decarboxylase